MALEKPTAADVKAIIKTALSDSQVNAVIDDAALMAEACLSSLDSARQKAALKWLAAHLLASTDASAVRTSRKLGDAADTYARAQLGAGIAGTTYGQQAVALAPCLASLGQKPAIMETL